MIDKTVEKLQQYIDATGMSQREASTIFEVNKYTLNRWLKGKTNPSPVYKKLIEKKLKKYS